MPPLMAYFQYIFSIALFGKFSNALGFFLLLLFMLFGKVKLPLTIMVSGICECHARYVFRWLGLQPDVVSTPVCRHHHRCIQTCDSRLDHKNGY